MKKIISLVFALFLFLFFLASCATQSETAVSNASKKPAPASTATKSPSTKQPKATAAAVKYATYTPASSRGSSNTSSTQIDTVIEIPSYNENAPSGILEQLAWGGRGGGPVPTATPLPTCNGCFVEFGYSETSWEKAYFKNFNPKQKLKILFYRATGESDSCGQYIHKYAAGPIVQVDNDGELTVSVNDSEYIDMVAVLDVTTGIKVWENQYAPYGDSETCSETSSCPGAPPQRLQVNKMAYVCTAKDVVKLRSGPGKSYDALKSLVPGADITVIGGPKCANNWSWWKVKTESGYTGWMTEGGDSADKYFLCPRK